MIQSHLVEATLGVLFFFKGVIFFFRPIRLSLFVACRCASGRPEENDHLRLNPHSIVVLHGTGKDQPSGQLKDLKLFNTTLSKSTVRSKCRCELNTYAAPCATTVLKAPSAALTMYSSVRNRDAPGVGFGRGRLNSPQAYWFLFLCIGSLQPAKVMT